MSKIAVVLGIGPNNLLIPCLVFQDMDQAIQHLKDEGLFDYFTKKTRDSIGDYYTTCDEECTVWKKLNSNYDEEFASKFFKSYYGGCGECNDFTLIEVEQGKPFIAWNLD